MKNILSKLQVDYLLVCATNAYLTEYSSLEENSRYTLTGFSGSTGDALITKNKIYLFVDGRYHIQADKEAKPGITVVKLQVGQSQDNEIKKLINPQKILGIVSKKISQARLENFKGYNIKLIEEDPINNFTKKHDTTQNIKIFDNTDIKITKPVLVTNLEEVSYITGQRNFTEDCSSKIWAKLFIDEHGRKIFYNGEGLKKFLSTYDNTVIVDKNSINAHDYSCIKNPKHKISEIKRLKSIKSQEEILSYKDAFKKTDEAVYAIRDFIENNNNLTEYDIAQKLRECFKNTGAKSLSFKSIVAINQNSALAHYSENSKNVYLKESDLVLIDCGAYYNGGLATDITRVFVKGQPNNLQKEVYTTVLKAFLNAFNSNLKTGFALDNLAHKLLDNKIDGFVFNHGLGHGIGINVHEAPPALNKTKIAHTKIQDNMTFTIEPGLYNKEHFGIRLENSCYKENGKTKSFVRMGYEGKLINYDLLTPKEQEWLKEFEIL